MEADLTPNGQVSAAGVLYSPYEQRRHASRLQTVVGRCVTTRQAANHAVTRPTRHRPTRRATTLPTLLTSKLRCITLPDEATGGFLPNNTFQQTADGATYSNCPVSSHRLWSPITAAPQ